MIPYKPYVREKHVESIIGTCLTHENKKGFGYMAWKWIRISLKSWMVSWYKKEILQASVSNCMRQ
jgi:hypothetical protein